MKQLYASFDKVHFEGTRFMVVDESEGQEEKYTVNAERLMHYWLKGDPEPILAPRIFVFSITSDYLCPDPQRCYDMITHAPL
jgi:hypothetical protein